MSGIMPTVGTLLTGDHFYALLALAVVVCWLASLGSVSLFRLAMTSQSAIATAWLLIVGLSTGNGVWATDLIFVEAYIPNLPIRYHPVLVAFALVAAIAVMTAGLWVAAKRSAFWC